MQGSLFLRPDDPRRLALMGANDGINRRYGRDRVRFAGTALERDCELKAEFHSPRYTTRWDELLRVRNRRRQEPPPASVSDRRV